MRYTIQLILGLLAAALAAGCTEEANAAITPPTPVAIAAAARLDDVKAETKEAARAIDEYVFAKKVEFVSNMKNELTAIQVKMDQLALETDRTSGEIKDDAKARLETLRAKWSDTKARLELAERANESDWEDMKAGFRQSQADLAASFDTMRQWLSDKIEP
jgi:capsule polysaccharide export protein KpsE/RkpR